MVITDTSYRPMRLSCGPSNLRVLGVFRGQNTTLSEMMIENYETNAGYGRELKANG